MISYQDMLDVAKARLFRYKTPWKVWQIICLAFSAALMLYALVSATVYSVNLDSHPVTYQINHGGTLKVEQGSLYLNNELINKSSPNNTDMLITAGFFIGVFIPPLFVYYMRTSGSKERQKYYNTIVKYWLEHKELPEENS